jgi:hypothetical protein
MTILKINGRIIGMKYTPFLCRNLKNYDWKDFDFALGKESSFLLDVDKNNEIAISYWVSAKRTRSYPYARVYDTLSFSGKKITIIPIFKDEGKDGDRDFLQWDTISLMSLLGIYVIISYYNSAEKSSKYGNKNGNKITNQRFDYGQIKGEIKKLLNYQSDALHWNLEQIDKVGDIGEKALDNYKKISKKTGVQMSSESSGRKRIEKLKQDKKIFMEHSRFLAKSAQKRESSFTQPHENVDGSKATLTITNYLKGNYFFTCDESRIEGNNVFLIEAKHTTKESLPSQADIKDGLIKMNIFTNLKTVLINGKNYNVKPVLKLTTATKFDLQKFREKNEEFIKKLKKESKNNNFVVTINSEAL